MKTKNVPKVLKCKINTKIFFWIRGSQKGGVGGPTFGKNSQIISFFFSENVPKCLCYSKNFNIFVVSQMMMGGHKCSIPPEEYVFAATLIFFTYFSSFTY